MNGRVLVRLGIVGLAGCLLVLSQTGSAAAAVGVVPSKIELAIIPGGSQTKNVRVVNGNANPLKVHLQAWDFARDEYGQSYPIGPKDVKQFRGMADWVSYDRGDFMVAPKKTGTVRLTVRVPRDAEPGGHYTYVRFTGVPLVKTKKGMMMPVKFNISALVVVEVAGEATSGGPPVLKADAQIVDLVAPRVSFGGPVALQIFVKNAGNVHLNFKGKVRLGKGQYQMRPTTIPEYTLLPYTKLNIVQEVAKNLPFGYYEVKAIGDVGLKKPIEASTGFWVVPTSIILWALGGVAALIAIVLLLRGRFELVRRPA